MRNGWIYFLWITGSASEVYGKLICNTYLCFYAYYIFTAVHTWG